MCEDYTFQSTVNYISWHLYSASIDNEEKPLRQENSYRSHALQEFRIENTGSRTRERPNTAKKPDYNATRDSPLDSSDCA